MSPARRFRRSSRGVDVALEPAEADALARLPAELQAVLDDTEQPSEVRRRLFPRAYLDPTEEEAEQEWQRLSHSDLLAGKLQSVKIFEESLERAERGRRRVAVALDEAEATAWLTVLNDARLALGVVLGVTEDLDLADLDPGDPRTPGLHLYGWLTWLQGDLVEAVSG